MTVLKFLGVTILLSLAWLLIIPGVIWQLAIFKQTAYRPIDLLLLVVPVASIIVACKTTWRYVSPTRYWETSTSP